MEKTKYLLLTFLIILILACENKQIKTPFEAMTKFEKFKAKEKFIEDIAIYYPGIGSEKLKPILTKKINLAAEDFEKIAEKENATEEDYQNAIEIGLNRFKPIYLEIDTEDRERICIYFEELMDIVKLESSGGHLNDFMYEFDPTEN